MLPPRAIFRLYDGAEGKLVPKRPIPSTRCSYIRRNARSGLSSYWITPYRRSLSPSDLIMERGENHTLSNAKIF